MNITLSSLIIGGKGKWVTFYDIKSFHKYEICSRHKFEGPDEKKFRNSYVDFKGNPTSLARTDPFVTLSAWPRFLRVFQPRNIG